MVLVHLTVSFLMATLEGGLAAAETPPVSSAGPEPDELSSVLLRATWSSPPSKEAFTEHWLRDGLVLIRARANNGSRPGPLLLEDAGDLVDGYMRSQRLVRNQMASPATHGKALNPENSTALASPLRVTYTDHHTLAPADHTVQGPHQEGMGPSRNNRRAIAFVCEAPSVSGGGTALFDMQAAWRRLPSELQGRLRRASFGHTTYEGYTLKVPCAVRHEHTDAPCLQFYCFGRVSRDCTDAYRHRTGRFHVAPDPYSYHMDHGADMLLFSTANGSKPFIALDLHMTLDSIYRSMVEHTWTRGDILVVDNVRWAHARLEGAGKGRRVHFITYGPGDKSFDLTKWKRL